MCIINCYTVTQKSYMTWGMGLKFCTTSTDGTIMLKIPYIKGGLLFFPYAFLVDLFIHK